MIFDLLMTGQLRDPNSCRGSLISQIVYLLSVSFYTTQGCAGVWLNPGKSHRHEGASAGLSPLKSFKSLKLKYETLVFVKFQNVKHPF